MPVCSRCLRVGEEIVLNSYNLLTARTSAAGSASLQGEIPSRRIPHTDNVSSQRSLSPPLFFCCCLQGGGGAAGMAARSGAGAPKVKCKICMQELITTNAKSLQEHVDAKHSKSTLAICFPDITPP